MSSARPLAFWSAMSIRTTSASSFTAIARATVAPTFPAPPTTVTLRFMRLPLLQAGCPSQVLDDRVGELRRAQLRRALHQACQVVRDPLLLDGPAERGGDQVRSLLPAEVLEHHHARQDDGRRVDDVLAGVLGRGA